MAITPLAAAASSLLSVLQPPVVLVQFLQLAVLVVQQSFQALQLSSQAVELVVGGGHDCLGVEDLCCLAAD